MSKKTRSHVTVDKKGKVHVFYKHCGGFHELIGPMKRMTDEELKILDAAFKKSFSKTPTRL